MFIFSIYFLSEIDEGKILFGIGKIFTNASSEGNSGAYGNGMRNRNGIQIHCVEKVGEQYKKSKRAYR